MPKFLSDIILFGKLIKFSHTVFALPFALSMFVVVTRFQPVNLWQLALILLCMVTARTAAMGFNRLVDKDVDAKNPRTQMREIPAGLIAAPTVAALVIISAGLFLLFSGLLGRHCLIMAPLVLAVLFFYSWTKRFTRYSHMVLGLALALAPGGVWYALTGGPAILPLYLMGAVLLWVAGFDILYSCQDYDFDKKTGLFSLPVALGISGAMRVAQLLHILTVILLIQFGLGSSSGSFYYIAVAIFTLALISQHRLVSPTDLSKIDAAFFVRNGLGSLVFFIGVLVDRFLS